MIAGHVTWNGAPAVFFKPAELDPGDRIEVHRADGSTATFTVDRTAVHPKDRFPPVEVYRNLDHAGGAPQQPHPLGPLPRSASGDSPQPPGSLLVRGASS
ncbi:sortase domain-bontaining protein [Streptomyces sp. NPDC127037]|uniref:sortase domain-containing protein n=1 Tax=Streptomyces sp. NPDC127037 TaxID=3347113 RepID=UPI003668AD16